MPVWVLAPLHHTKFPADTSGRQYMMAKDAGSLPVMQRFHRQSWTPGSARLQPWVFWTFAKEISELKKSFSLSLSITLPFKCTHINIWKYMFLSCEFAFGSFFGLLFWFWYSKLIFCVYINARTYDYIHTFSYKWPNNIHTRV